MSVRGCYTDFHVDFGGTSVWYHIHQGGVCPQSLKTYSLLYVFLLPPLVLSLSIMKTQSESPFTPCEGGRDEQGTDPAPQN